MKKQIERADDGFPVKAQKFMFKGEPLKNEKGTIEENGLDSGTKLYLVKRLRTNSAELLDPPPRKTSSNAGSNAMNRGQQQQLIRVVCPANARPGSRVRISLSDGRQLMVQVPQGVGPGMPFQVALQARRETRTPWRNSSASGRRIVQPRTSSNNVGTPQRRLLRVLCPTNARPGSIVAINIPGRGPIHVRVPLGVYPGQPFNVQL